MVPRPAATVVLLRDSTDGPEAYLLRRMRSMAFAGGMHAFPGGAVDRRDADGTIAWAGPTPSEWAALLGADEPMARAFVCAAVRETFEESGVLLAGPSADAVVDDTTGGEWEAARVALVERRLSLTAFLDERRLVLRSDLLGAWAHWITPEFEERRYDTRFFVAALPTGQRTRDVSGEADEVRWMRPALAARAWRAGEMAMLPPTVVTLDELAGFGSAAETIVASRSRVLRPVVPVPVLTPAPDGDQLRLLLPGDEGYPT